MLWKLSITGIKGRLRDYIVLFFGLMMSSGIFYMFEAMAMNKDFLESNSTIAATGMIFQLGSVLLAIITLVYILYANSFLMAMRQKDYAMFMMLGAKSRKIAQMIFIETFAVGVLATAAGSVVGIGLSAVVNTLLTQQMHVNVSHFTAFNTKGLLVTLIFYAVLFLIAAILNAGVIVKKPILKLLRDNATPNRLQKNKLRLFIEAVFGILFLASGYYMMTQIDTFGLLALEIALVTIVLGSYLLFHSVVIAVITLLKKSDRLVFKGLTNFTLSQLSFRIRDYTQMLSMVSILFALALGASTVGLGFHNEVSTMTKATTSYDIIVNNAQKMDQAQIDALKPTLNVSYSQKEDAETVYYNQEEFDQNPLQQREYVGKADQKWKKIQVDGASLAADVNKQDGLRSMETPDQSAKEIKIVTAQAFAALELPETKLQVVQVADFMAHVEEIGKIVHQNEQNNPSVKPLEAFDQRYNAYTVYNSMYSGFQFMGFFLGLAFLTMLASCLMFKILSGANSDVIRYAMLEKIGTRRGLLKASIRKEIGVLFAAPGILGVVHVLFGLQMFKLLMSDPYYGIWLPFLIFFILYLIYYSVTVWIYTGIVLKKKESY